jgi:hypothetical protein
LITALLAVLAALLGVCAVLFCVAKAQALRAAAAEKEPAAFADQDGGLWLAYKQYRALERNIRALRRGRAMRLDSSLIFSLPGALASLGGLCAWFGIPKGKAEHAVEENRAQAEQLKTCAAKEDAAAAVKQIDGGRKQNPAQAKETGTLNAMLKAVKESLDELKNKIRDGLKELRRGQRHWPGERCINGRRRTRAGRSYGSGFSTPASLFVV